MIGLDTNVLVRYIMQDDPRQSPRATRLIESLTPDDPGLVPLVCVVELVWVLDTCYALKRTQLVEALETLLRTRELEVQSAEVVWSAVRIYRESAADFADCMIERGAASVGCVRTMTFDAGAAKHCRMTLMP